MAMIKCGNHNSRTKHNNAEQVKMCYQGAEVVSSELVVTPCETYTLSVVAFPEDDDNGAAAAEQAYERYLEDRGANEARLQDDMEARSGVISFSDAWDLADPSRIAEREAWLVKQRFEKAANSWSRADRERAQASQIRSQATRDAYGRTNRSGSDCSGRPPVPTKGGRPVFPEVAPGHYAIEVDDVIKFYKVDHGKEGTRWAGYVFLSVQASDDFHPIKNQGAKREILHAIAADPQEAMTRYGREIGKCGAAGCGRTLTDPESRARGIGPICAGKLGW
jgi:hypothetical protein